MEVRSRGLVKVLRVQSMDRSIARQIFQQTRSSRAFAAGFVIPELSISNFKLLSLRCSR
ncbi:hypothetical protein Mapa_000043 [Marchantia paleacea]|nr:hypothetical protein Mapa_000043 [Marchantia paleacea]